GVERDRRRREKIVARSLVSHPWTAITGAPECEVSQWIIVTGDPHRPTTGLPLISVWPSLAAGFTGTRYGIGLPQGIAGLGIECRDKAPNAEFAARGADDHLAVGDKRRQRHVVPGHVVFDLGGPHLLAGLDIERDEHGVSGGEKDLVSELSDAAVGWM